MKAIRYHSCNVLRVLLECLHGTVISWQFWAVWALPWLWEVFFFFFNFVRSFRFGPVPSSSLNVCCFCRFTCIGIISNWPTSPWRSGSAITLRFVLVMCKDYTNSKARISASQLHFLPYTYTVRTVDCHRWGNAHCTYWSRLVYSKSKESYRKLSEHCNTRWVYQVSEVQVCTQKHL